jgi:hypothetical protein
MWIRAGADRLGPSWGWRKGTSRPQRRPLFHRRPPARAPTIFNVKRAHKGLDVGEVFVHGPHAAVVGARCVQRDDLRGRRGGGGGIWQLAPVAAGGLQALGTQHRSRVTCQEAPSTCRPPPPTPPSPRRPHALLPQHAAPRASRRRQSRQAGPASCPPAPGWRSHPEPRKGSAARSASATGRGVVWGWGAETHAGGCGCGVGAQGEGRGETDRLAYSKWQRHPPYSRPPRGGGSGAGRARAVGCAAHLADQLAHAPKAADDDVAAHAAHLTLLGLRGANSARPRRGECRRNSGNHGVAVCPGALAPCWSGALRHKRGRPPQAPPTCSAFMSLFSSIWPSLPPNWARNGVSAMLQQGQRARTKTLSSRGVCRPYKPTPDVPPCWLASGPPCHLLSSW